MQVGAPMPVASEEALLVSPPPLVMEESYLSDLCSTSSTAPSQSSQVATDMTPDGSPARIPATSETLQEDPYTREPPTTPETVSCERVGSENASTSTQGEKDAKTKQFNVQKDANVASLSASEAGNEAAGHTSGTDSETSTAHGAMKQKSKDMWFDVLPIVLQNLKTHDREQIRQIELPRCEVCVRGKESQKAAVRCMQQGCVVSDRPLCLVCWESTHSSADSRKHRRQPSSLCQLCQLDQITYWCAECDLKFCNQCFERIHSVSATKFHRKLATEDAPGTSIAAAHWSMSFQNLISQTISSRKDKIDSNIRACNRNAKRVRHIETIVIDEDDTSEGEKEVVIQSTQSKSTASQQRDNPMRTQCASTHSSIPCPQPQQGASADTYRHDSGAQHSMIEPIPFLQEPALIPSISLAQQATSGYITSSILHDTNSVNVTTNAGSVRWNDSTLPFNTSSVIDNSSGRKLHATSVVDNRVTQVASRSVPTIVDTTSGEWSTTSAIRTDLTNSSNRNIILPLGGAVFAENALVDSLADRYHEVNQNVTNIELQSEQLSRQIAIATCQGPYNAGSLMALLRKLQPVLETAKAQRDKLLIAMIIQSNDIMASVRLLRIAELGDVPQVPMISHRKCLQLSNEINQHKKKLIELNQQLSDTLSRSHAINSKWENSLIRTTSASIQMHEKTIRKLKKARETELVRIVQFDFKVREALKRTIQRAVEAQRQQKQQSSQFQTYG